jgi:type IV pilus assembly protein PilY1
VEISDAPLYSSFQAAPANVMFILDDSGSMNFEILTNETDTEFTIPGLATNANKRYVFNDPGDHTYSMTTQGILGHQRRYWKSQFSGYNKMYYDPLVSYVPWPNKSDADTQTPKSHPSRSWTFDITEEYYKLTEGMEVIVDDGDGAFGTADGFWETITLDGRAQGNDWRRTTLLADDRKWAEWRPNLIPARYEVWVRWVDDAALHDIDVEYHVFSDTTTHLEEVEVDQRDPSGGTDPPWELIGTYDFTDTGFVRLELDTHESGLKQASADAVKFTPVGASLSITRAHYYTWVDADFNEEWDSGEDVYLVNFVDEDPVDGVLDTRKWYRFVDTNSDDQIALDELTLTAEGSVPSSLKQRTTAEDLQNFANWYTYYRRRELTAIGAVATVITQVQGMQIGFYSIHNRIKQPVLKVHVDGVDKTDVLLDVLYNQFYSDNSTPLRLALANVGRYFDQDDGEDGNLGDSPYWAAEDGGACQQCFAILMTDGAYNGGEAMAPGTNADGDDGAPYADTYSNTLADVAMYYYERDLSTGLDNEVPTNPRDGAQHQHMVTYSVGFGIHGNLAPEEYDDSPTSPDYLKCLAGAAGCTEGEYVIWPDPAAGAEPTKVDDTWHATVNGRGKYFSASNARELTNDFLLILKDIKLYSNSASSVAVNGDQLFTQLSSDVRLYQAKYYNQTWHGDILSYRVNDLNGQIIYPAEWSAAKLLASKQASSRLIATYDGTSSGLPFRYSSLTSLQRDQLDDNWETDATLATEMVGYLRGEYANEQAYGGNFRNRSWSIVDPDHPYNGDIIVSSKLGDTVHSSPTFLNGVLYAGANDGMLHAFDAATGEEIFAYVPNLVFGNLNLLTQPGYSHRYYVDLAPTVRNVNIGSIGTMLVGGLGKGGQGYFALDLTGIDPGQNMVPADEADVAGRVLWEYPPQDNSGASIDQRKDMGYSFSKAAIVQSYDATYPWIVIIGNGYNSDNGRAKLLILDPASGNLIKSIDTEAGYPVLPLPDPDNPPCADANGLSTPTPVDVDFDGKVDYVYAGDLQGNMWKFNLTAPDSGNWEVSFFEGTTKKPLFKTPSQPITTRPDVMAHCDKDGYMVLFGTGQLLGDADIADARPQSVYGIWDYGDDDLDPLKNDDSEYVGAFAGGALTNPNLLGSNFGLMPQVVSEHTVNNVDWRSIGTGKPDWHATTLDGASCGDYDPTDEGCDPTSGDQLPDPVRDLGWYINLPTAGERVVNDVMIRDRKLIFISYTPETSVCGSSGHSWLMEIAACTGSRWSGTVFDVNGDGDIDGQDVIDPSIPIPPTGPPKIIGHMQPPAILIEKKNGNRPPEEYKYGAKSTGKIEVIKEPSVRLGLFYWRIVRP